MTWELWPRRKFDGAIRRAAEEKSIEVWTLRARPVALRNNERVKVDTVVTNGFCTSKSSINGLTRMIDFAGYGEQSQWRELLMVPLLCLRGPRRLYLRRVVCSFLKIVIYLVLHSLLLLLFYYNKTYLLLYLTLSLSVFSLHLHFFFSFSLSPCGSGESWVTFGGKVEEWESSFSDGRLYDSENDQFPKKWERR